MRLSGTFITTEKYVRHLQDHICHELEGVNGRGFTEVIWHREEGGGGRTRVVEQGSVFEKGCVNFSHVYGRMPEDLAQQLKTDTANFAACAISSILHPKSPRLPTIHMNLRFFEMQNGTSWFGGGIDLTPYYPYPQDFIYFHQTLKDACDQAMPGSYGTFKEQCDAYFTIKHRKEMRGIGGILFDHLSGDEDRHHRLVQAVGDAFLGSYLPIVNLRKDDSFTEIDKQFQLIRRGRYVEFNLMYDRGTLFGLKTDGRIESILASLPPTVSFPHDWRPNPNSPHEEMCGYYQARSWVE